MVEPSAIKCQNQLAKRQKEGNKMASSLSFRSGNPALGSETFNISSHEMNTMTLEGAVNKTAIGLFLVTGGGGRQCLAFDVVNKLHVNVALSEAHAHAGTVGRALDLVTDPEAALLLDPAF